MASYGLQVLATGEEIIEKIRKKVLLQKINLWTIMSISSF